MHATTTEHESRHRSGGGAPGAAGGWRPDEITGEGGGGGSAEGRPGPEAPGSAARGHAKPNTDSDAPTPWRGACGSSARTPMRGSPISGQPFAVSRTCARQDPTPAEQHT